MRAAADKFLIIALLLLLFSCESAPVHSEEAPAAPLKWQTLADLSFEKKYSADSLFVVYYPRFGDTVRSYAAKPVSLAGYVIELEDNRYYLSATPFSSCFFCGKNGPESVLYLALSDSSLRLNTDEYLSFGGLLKLNDSDESQVPYILEQARPLGDATDAL